jgi:glycine cleavage system aminomethyltransferase T
VRLLEVEASTTDEKNQTIFVNFNTVEWDAEGTIKITKNDKIKKQFDFVGREKGGKPKKEKKPKKVIVNTEVEEPRND